MEITEGWVLAVLVSPKRSHRTKQNSSPPASVPASVHRGSASQTRWSGYATVHPLVCRFPLAPLLGFMGVYTNLCASTGHDERNLSPLGRRRTGTNTRNWASRGAAMFLVPLLPSHSSFFAWCFGVNGVFRLVSSRMGVLRAITREFYPHRALRLI